MAELKSLCRLEMIPATHYKQMMLLMIRMGKIKNETNSNIANEQHNTKEWGKKPSFSIFFQHGQNGSERKVVCVHEKQDEKKDEKIVCFPLD